MAGKSKKTSIVTFRLEKDVLARLRRSHPNVSEYLRDRVTYDVTRKHRKRGQTGIVYLPKPK